MSQIVFSRPQEFFRTLWGGDFLWNSLNGLLDLIYPPHCLVCGRFDCPPICAACLATAEPLPEPLCLVCGRMVAGAMCDACAEAQANGGWGFDRAWAATRHQGAVREAIHCLKYQKKEPIAEPLGEYLAQTLQNHFLSRVENFAPTAIVPVPLHSKRQRERGFNQAESLAKPLSRHLGVPLRNNWVVRVRKTRSQVGLDAAQRRANLTGNTFVVKESCPIQNTDILLVDDVYTTGTTLSTVARVLKEAGARTVVAVALTTGV